MDKLQATDIATRHRITLGVDFHSLGSEEVGRILDAAKERKYREPRNANGSRARYFYSYLNRAVRRV